MRQPEIKEQSSFQYTLRVEIFAGIKNHEISIVNSTSESNFTDKTFALNIFQNLHL